MPSLSDLIELDIKKSSIKYELDKNKLHNFFSYENVSSILKNTKFNKEIRRKKNFSYSITDLGVTDHFKLKKEIIPFFNQNTVNEFRKKINQIVHNRLEFLESKKEVDLISDYSSLVPSDVVSEIFDIPKSLSLALQKKSSVTLEIADVDNMNNREIFKTVKKNQENLLEITSLMLEVIYYKKQNIGNDIVSFLIKKTDLSISDILATCIFIYLAAVETTSSSISSSIFLVMQDENLKNYIKEKEMSENVIQELLRCTSPVTRVLRKCDEDTMFSINEKNVLVKKEEIVLLDIAAANMDRLFFDSPEKINFDRPNSNRNLSFSTGSHYCLGSFFAKEEIKSAVKSFFLKFDNIKLIKNPVWKETVTMRGMDSFLVSLK